MELIREADFPIQPLYQFAANLGEIVHANPELVGDVYRTIFGADEPSESKTNMGGSTILVMTSTRRQDLGMCHYLLFQYFPKYLQGAFHSAIRAGVDGVNANVKRKHVDDGTGRTCFTFRGGSAVYIADRSVFWATHSDPHEPVLVLGVICSRLDEILGQSGRTLEIEQTLDVFRDEQVAIFWKRLLELVAKHPSQLHDTGVELCTSPVILSGRDTIYEACAALSALASVMTPAEMAQVEQTILALDSEDRRKRLISQIPSALVVTTDAKKLRAELEKIGQVVPNRRLVEFKSYVREYTAEDWLADKGVDLGKPANKRLRELSAVLSASINPTNEPVSAHDLQVAHGAATALWFEIQVKSDADEDVSDTAWITLGHYSLFVLTNVEDTHDPLSAQAREMIFACGQRVLPQGLTDRRFGVQRPCGALRPVQRRPSCCLSGSRERVIVPLSRCLCAL